MRSSWGKVSKKIHNNNIGKCCIEHNRISKKLLNSWSKHFAHFINYYFQPV